jgi:hypothetical protein
VGAAGEAVLDFAAAVLRREGALVEPAGQESIAAVLPAGLQQALGLQEYAVLSASGGGGGATPCGYGSEALRELARLAVGGGCAAAFRVEAAPCPLKAPDAFHGLNLSLRVLGTSASSGWTIVGSAHYQATSDDERSGLAEAAVTFPEGAPVAAPLLASLSLAPLPPAELHPEALRQVFPALLDALQRDAVAKIEGFRSAVARRAARDLERLDRYFSELAADLRRRARRAEGGALAAKIASLPLEKRRKEAQIESDRVVRLRLNLVGLVALHGPVALAELEARRRKHTRSLTARFDGAARRWVGLRCDGCGTATFAFALCDDAAHVLCKECWDACGTGGHRPCFRCSGKPPRRSWVERGAPAPAEAASVTRVETQAERLAEPVTAAEPPAVEVETSRGEAPIQPEAGCFESPEEEAAMRDRVLGVLGRFRVPLSSEEVRAHVPLSAQALRQLIGSLVASGAVGRVGERRGTKYFLLSQHLASRDVTDLAADADRPESPLTPRP